jgi:tRNA(Ile)-lysidine synthase
VHALHVHHGLHADADAWQAQVAAQCRRWRRPTGSRCLPRPPRAGAAAARRQPRGLGPPRALRRTGRHGAAAGCSLVLLAHHRRDQAETVLLQALRGAGPAGLSAMPARVERGADLGPALARPAAQRHRGYVRRWRCRRGRPGRTPMTAPCPQPAAAAAVAGAGAAPLPTPRPHCCAVARRAQEARAIVDEVARADLAQVADTRGLLTAAWAELGPARRTNVLRHWLGQQLDRPGTRDPGAATGGGTAGLPCGQLAGGRQASSIASWGAGARAGAVGGETGAVRRRPQPTRLAPRLSVAGDIPCRAGRAGRRAGGPAAAGRIATAPRG